tara:strand:- start:264 stop:845 length:582 start_codon:yes stop_codon:yes gene_type:complete
MKLFTNKKELNNLSACSSGYKTFIEAHGEKDATLSQCLTSNGWDDIWWLISETFDQFSDQQKVDLRLLGCEYALSSIDNFEKEFPDDKRPRLAIEASISFTEGSITQEELFAARGAATSAAWSARGAKSARGAATSAAWSAAESAKIAKSAAESAARFAAESAAWSARGAEVMQFNTAPLMNLLIKWENINET